MSRNAAAMAKLATWAKRFEELASPQQKGALTKEMSKAALGFIEEGFRTESTPYRSKWRPKKRPNGEQILMETGKMRRGFKAKVGLNRFGITNSRSFVNTHQYGYPAKNIPRRQMWPSPNRLPAAHVRAYSKIFTRRTFAILRGKKV